MRVEVIDINEIKTNSMAKRKDRSRPVAQIHTPL